jgi:hypothetical protein
MKLLTELKRQLAELGPLKRVWLTSFNLSIEFVETHVLPALLDNSKPPVGRMDFETLQLDLLERDIDVRIFADKRMIHRSDRKRTAIAVHALTPRQLHDFSFSADSLFHPKVIYLEDKDGRAVLGTGSANLTVSGWGRNQEAMLFRKVATQVQSEQIKAFFKPLLLASNDDAPLRLGKEYWGADQSWEFVHSLAGRPFLDRLLPDDVTVRKLGVWSPYFSGDLASFLDALRSARKQPGLSVQIVPDLLEGRVRTRWQKAMEQQLQSGHLSFHPNQIARHPNSEMCHAKIWVTATQIAVGSWNCTGPGSNILAPGADGISYNNIEAGILLRQASNLSGLMGEAWKMSRSNFSTQEQLDEQKLEVPEELPFDIAVDFDWKEQIYTVSIDWIDTKREGYTLILPDVTLAQPVAPLKRLPLKIAVTDPKHLLTNHYFVVRNGANDVYQGIINQTFLEQRRIDGYASLDELLDSRIPNRQGNCGDGDTVLRGEKSDGDGDGDGDLVPPPATVHSSSYFRLFRAMETFAGEIKNAKSLDQLERNLFVRPGCLAELREKIVERASAGETGTVYQWFLVLEYRRLDQTARKKYRQLLQSKAVGPRWDALALAAGPAPRGADPRYIEMIMKDGAYA